MAYVAPTHRARPAHSPAPAGWFLRVAGWLKRRALAHLDAPLRPW